MARARGGSSQVEGRERPMALIHRGDRRGGCEDVVVEVFPGRPNTNGSLLVTYRDRVAF